MLKPNAFKTVEFEIKRHKVRGISNGNETAPLLLCLHGWLDNSASFMPLIPHLSDFHVIAIDWPGHGLSDHRSEDAHYHFLDWVDDLINLFRVQQWQSVDIVGHSMGGMVASAFAAAFPEHVKSLTLIDTLGFLTSKAETSTEQLRKGLLSRIAIAGKTKKYHESLDSAIAARVAVSDLSQENATLIVKRAIKHTEQGYIWRSDSRLRAVSPYRFTQAQAEQIISDITTPVQLLYGDKGLDMVTEGIENFGPLFKTLKKEKLSGGHHVHMEQVEQTAKLVSQFINQ